MFKWLKKFFFGETGTTRKVTPPHPIHAFAEIGDEFNYMGKKLYVVDLAYIPNPICSIPTMQAKYVVNGEIRTIVFYNSDVKFLLLQNPDRGIKREIQCKDKAKQQAS